MNPVVVAFSDHPHATAALRWGNELAGILAAPLHVVTVYEPTFAEIAPAWYADLVDERRHSIESALAEIDRHDAEIVVIESSKPFDAIAGHLVRHHAELCVVGAESTHGPGGLGAGPAGHLLRAIDVPLAAVSPGYQTLRGGIIVVGVDGSDANLGALRRAEHWAEAAHADIHAVFAYPPGDNAYSHPQPPFQHPGDWHRHSAGVRGEVNRIEAAPAKLFMEEGHPADVLMAHAEREQAAAIVVGTRGTGGFNGLRVGSVPVHLLAHASCPTIVVPH